jgi:phospholipid/cholesterol/gamma-HCH transport system substrate-binding protein
MRTGEYRWSQVRVGLFLSICGIILFASLFYFGITGVTLSRHAVVHAAFDDAFGLATGSPVEMGGVVVGEIKDLELPDVKTGRVPVTLSIEPGALQRLGPSSVAFTSSHALVGQRFVGLTVRHEGETPLENGGWIQEQPSKGIEARAAETLDKVDVLLTQVGQIANSVGRMTADVEAGHGTIGRLLRDESLYDGLAATAANAAAATDEVRHGHGTIAALLGDAKLAGDVRSTVGALAQTAEGVQQGRGVLGRLTSDETDARRIDETLANLQTVTGNLSSGKGTLGALISDSTLMDRVDAVLGQIGSLVGDVRRNPQRYLKFQAF